MPPDDTAAPAANDAAAAGGLPRTRWRKARSSGAENGGCVEVAEGLRGLIGIRDSHRLRDGAHFVSTAAFTAFLADVKAGVYDMGPE